MQHFLTIPRAYSSVIFTRNTVTGAFILLSTFWHPNIGLAGLLAAITGMATMQFFSFPEDNKEIHVLNSLLVGLSLGLFFKINIFLLIIIVFCSIITIFFSITLADVLGRTTRTPVLSLPFILVSVMSTYIARGNSNLDDYYSLTSFNESVFGPWYDMFFSSIGATFFSPHPVSGLIIFICLFICSRYLAILAVAGYLLGFSMFVIIVDNPDPDIIAWSGFNFMLTAIALGGIYSVPGLHSFSFAMLGVCLTAIVSTFVQKILLSTGLPVMALPFVFITSIMLIASSKRSSHSGLTMAIVPGPPEINFERSRLAAIRQGGSKSIPLLAPFFGAWHVYQGFNGKHTHIAPWQHALDFIIQNNGKSYQGDGTVLEDYYCYGAPVLSPVFGTVVRTVENLPDNLPGELDTRNNWGNIVLIRLESGQHVLLAHLCRNSIKVKEGEWIKPGTPIANCGNSGRSPQPHLHLQVQENAQLGSATLPFHLCSIIKNHKDKTTEYMVILIPGEDDEIAPAEIDSKLASPLHLPVGKTLRYTLEDNSLKLETERTLRVEVSLAGQFRIVSDTGASIAFSEANGVLAFYDRSGPQDLLIDLWTLGLGLTPLTERASSWKDAPSASLLPMSAIKKLYLSTIHPLGAGLSSSYQRTWQNDKKAWVQSGIHVLETGTLHDEANSTAVLDTKLGCTELTLKLGQHQWRAVLIETGLKEDRGIPGWNTKVSSEPDKNLARHRHQATQVNKPVSVLLNTEKPV